MSEKIIAYVLLQVGEKVFYKRKYYHNIILDNIINTDFLSYIVRNIIENFYLFWHIRLFRFNIKIQEKKKILRYITWERYYIKLIKFICDSELF